MEEVTPWRKLYGGDCVHVCVYNSSVLCLAVRAAYSRAADRSMPLFCTSEEFVLLQLADFTSL